MELILVDPGTVVGPNYSSQPVCLECLKEVRSDLQVSCPGCRYPLCGAACVGGPRHRSECEVLGRSQDRQNQLDGNNKTNAYAMVTPLRVLQLMQQGGDKWFRTNQLMDHLERKEEGEWDWYQENIVNFLLSELRLGSEFTESDVHRAIGLLNVNAVCLQFPQSRGARNIEIGKGIY